MGLLECFGGVVVFVKDYLGLVRESDRRLTRIGGFGWLHLFWRGYARVSMDGAG